MPALSSLMLINGLAISGRPGEMRIHGPVAANGNQNWIPQKHIFNLVDPL